MRMLRVAVALFVVLSWASAASAAAFTTGTVEFGISGTFDHSGYSYRGDHVASSTRIVASPAVGYFFTPRLELNAGMLIDHTSLDVEHQGSQSATAFGVFGGGRWNFTGSGNVVPFVAASLGLIGWSGDAFSSSETTVIAPDLEAGLRFLVGDRASFNLGFDYAHSTNARVLDQGGGVTDLDANRLGVDFGVSIFPIRGR